MAWEKGKRLPHNHHYPPQYPDHDRANRDRSRWAAGLVSAYVARIEAVEGCAVPSSLGQVRHSCDARRNDSTGFRTVTVQELLAGLQHLPRDLEVLAFEAGWLLMLLFRVNCWLETSARR